MQNFIQLSDRRLLGAPTLLLQWLVNCAAVILWIQERLRSMPTDAILRGGAQDDYMAACFHETRGADNANAHAWDATAKIRHCVKK